MERNIEYIRSKLIDGDLISAQYTRVLALRRNDQTLLRFCMGELTDDETINLCNLILLTADLVSDRFEFRHYDDYYCYEIIFGDKTTTQAYFGIFVDKFPRQVTLVYISYSKESIDRTEHFKFTNLEDAEQIINNLMHQIYQSKEN